VVTRSVDELKARGVRRLDLTFARAVPDEELRRVDEVRQLAVDGLTAHLVVEGSTAGLLRAAAPYDVVNVVSHEADLGEIFLDYYSADNAWT
jgi:beta-exotoxin I transport system ATP-binding protein